MLKLSKNLQTEAKEPNSINNLRISNNLKENIHNDKIQAFAKYIKENLSELRNKYWIETYQLLLSWDWEKYMRIAKNGFVKATKIFTWDNNMVPSLRISFAKRLKTGNDYNNTCLEKPQSRGKFYHSFDFSSDKKIENIEKYLKEIYDSCCKKKISLQRKEFDHAYDYILYSHEPEELEAIIQSIYPKYIEKDIFIWVYHFLQKPLDWVNEQHIGFAEEPLYGTESHSSRITKLWKELDNWTNYQEACQKAWILAYAPRRIDYESSYWKTLIEKTRIGHEQLKKEYLEYLKNRI